MLSIKFSLKQSREMSCSVCMQMCVCVCRCVCVRVDVCIIVSWSQKVVDFIGRMLGYSAASKCKFVCLYRCVCVYVCACVSKWLCTCLWMCVCVLHECVCTCVY